MSVDDILFAPIGLDSKLRELVKKIMDAQPDDKLATTVAKQIVDLFRQNGINDEKHIVDAIRQIEKDLKGHLIGFDLHLAYALSREKIDAMMDAVLGRLPP